MFTFGRGMLGSAMMVGSITSRGFSFWMTAVGGVNCFRSARGSLPLLAGSGDLSPPPPPPPAVLGAGGRSGMYGDSSTGATNWIVFFTACWTCLLVPRAKAKATSPMCTTSEMKCERPR